MKILSMVFVLTMVMAPKIKSTAFCKIWGTIHRDHFICMDDFITVHFTGSAMRLFLQFFCWCAPVAITYVAIINLALHYMWYFLHWFIVWFRKVKHIEFLREFYFDNCELKLTFMKYLISSFFSFRIRVNNWTQSFFAIMEWCEANNKPI